MANTPLVLYGVLFLITIFAPLRWSIIAFLVLSNIDLGSLNASIGILNTAKAMVLPVYLLWRFRSYAGHERIASAPVAWGLLILYVAVASSWSLFPAYAIKLIGHMIGSLVICMMLMRATKAGYLNFQTVAIVSGGVIGMALFHWRFMHDWGGETDRFTTFSGAQAFAAFLTAFYCAALFARPVKLSLRIPLCMALAASVLANGSRLWILGLVLSTLAAVFVSEAKAWLKVVTLGLSLIVLAAVTIELDTVMDLLAEQAASNRIAAAISAAYEGNFKSNGLGTYNLRHELYQRTLDSIAGGSTMQVIFGHGTCNGALIAASLNKNPDPNRAMHDEFLRAIYEWGVAGLLLWLAFLIALFVYALKGARRDRLGYAKPLLIYLPAFTLGLFGENIIAGAGNAVSVGLLVLIALASISHRLAQRAVPLRARHHRLREIQPLRSNALARAT